MEQWFLRLPPRVRTLLLIALPLIVTAIAFYPSLSNGWTTWDDNIYVTDNPVVTSISPENLRIITTRALDGSYIPLTLFSYMVDYHIAGYDPAMYHRTNLLFHLLNVALFFVFVHRLSGSTVAAVVASILFGIHPMRVESVAWISGRKDVLSMAFFLGACIHYLRWIDQKPGRPLFWTFVFFIASLFSKPIGITFPLLLILFDAYRGRKLSVVLLTEKIPFAVVAGVFAVIAYLGQISVHALRPGTRLFDNAVISLHGIAFYIEKLFLPFRLSNLYVTTEPLTWDFYAMAMMTVAGFVLLWKYRENRTLIFGAMFFVIALLPVLQLVRFSKMFAADRFTYIAYCGLFFGAGIIAEGWWNNGNKRRLLVILSIITIALGTVTWERCGVWKDSQTLWQDMLSKYPDPVGPR